MNRNAKSNYVVKHPWNQGIEDMTAKELALLEQQRKSAENFEYRAPWDLEEDDLMQSFEKQLQALDFCPKRPWEETPSVIEEQERRKDQAKEYRYEPLWKKEVIPKRRLDMMRNYNSHDNCPFRLEDNYIPVKEVPAKRMINNGIQKSVAPWTVGSLPPNPVMTKIQPPKPTALWISPPEIKKKYLFEPSGDPILDSFRMQLFNHGANGILSLSKKFRIMDDDGRGTLDRGEFRKAMKELKVADLSDKAINHLFEYFDGDRSGTISLDEFLYGVRGSLNARRKSLVQQAFRILDRDNSGVITYDDVRDVYDTSSHPDVIEGKKTSQQVLNEFLQNFEKNSSVSSPSSDTEITPEEFERYYADISASIDDDDYFELLIRNAWHISGGSGWCENTTNRRVLVTHSDGRQTVEEVKNDLGVKYNDEEMIMKRLQSQGHNISKIDTRGRMQEDKRPSKGNNIYEDRLQSAKNMYSIPPGGQNDLVNDRNDIGSTKSKGKTPQSLESILVNRDGSSKQRNNGYSYTKYKT